MAEKKKQEPAAPADDKRKALETAISQIEKNYGKGAIMRFGDNMAVNVEAIPTGSLSLDLALGIGGVPKGRIIEIYGPESSGKTTLALHIIASAQKRGGEVAFIDAEHALEPAYARALGVDIESLLISQPDTGEDALAITETLVRSGAVDVVVIDSVAALVPRSEIEGEMGDSSVGVVARLMSQALRKLAGSISKTNCIVVFINQLREKIGVMYGSPRRRRAAAPSNISPASASTCGALSPSRTGRRSSATGRRPRSSRTRLRRPSRRPNSISCTERVFPGWESSSTWASSSGSSRRAAPGSPSAKRVYKGATA